MANGYWLNEDPGVREDIVKYNHLHFDFKKLPKLSRPRLRSFGMKQQTVQGQEVGTHKYRVGQIHLVSEYRKKTICGQAPMNLHQVDKEPTCKKCLYYAKMHSEFGQRFSGELTPFVPDPHSFHVWEFNKEMKFHFTEEARALFSMELALRGYYHHPLHHNLRKTTHRGTKPSKYPGAYKLWRLNQLRELLKIPHDWLESEIAAAFPETRDKSLCGPFPIHMNADWAWLFGLWSGCGSRYTREHQVKFVVEEGVLELLLDVAAKIGTKPHFHREYKKRRHKVWVYEVLFHRPIYEIMLKFGLPPHIHSDWSQGRKNTARDFYRTVPEWVKSDVGFSKAFLEGYLNTGRFQAWNYTAKYNKASGPRYYRTHGVDIRISSRSRKKTEEFADFVKGLLVDYHTTPHRVHANRKLYEIGLTIGDDGALARLLKDFKIRRDAAKLVSQELAFES